MDINQKNNESDLPAVSATGNSPCGVDNDINTVGNASPLLALQKPATGRIYLWLALVLAATFITYAGVLHHYFFLDDFWHILHASKTSFASLFDSWSYSAKDYQSYWFANAVVNNLTVPGFFRPLVTIVYWAGMHLWGAAPMPFHLLNLIGELLTVAVVFWIGYRLFERGWAAGFCAAVFALHPAQYATVEWIAANADVMMGLFATLSVACFIEYLRGVKHWRWFYALTVVSLILALCSKEMAGVLPGVYFGVVCLLGRRAVADDQSAGGRSPSSASWAENLLSAVRQIISSRWKGFLVIVLIVLAYGLWRLPSAVGIYSLHTTGDYMVHLSNPAMLPQIFLNFAFYIGNFLFLYPIWPMNFAPVLGANIWWIAVICITVLVIAALALARVAHLGHYAKGQSGAKVFWFGIWWIVIVLLPFCVLVPAQRIAHLPSVGFAIAFGAVAVGLADRFTAHNCQVRLRIAAVAVLTLYAGITGAYVSMMGEVSSDVRRVVVGLQRQIEGAPKGSEIYVMNLWQPAWMFEHFFEAKYQKQDYHIHVLSFSPNMLTMMMRQDPGAVQRWFATWFPKQAAYKPVSVAFTGDRSLAIKVKGGAFFHGLVEGELPVAPEAQKIGNVVDAGCFTAQSLGSKDGNITELKFHWEKQANPPARLFLQWTHGHWKRLTPPKGWSK